MDHRLNLNSMRLIQIFFLFLFLTPGILISTPIDELNTILESTSELAPTSIIRRMDIEQTGENFFIARAQRLPSLTADIQFNTTAEDREDVEDVIWRTRPFNRISASQPLYHWNALLRAQQIAELQGKYSELNYALSLRNLQQEVRNLYFQILELEMTKYIAEARVESDKRLVETREQSLELGRTSSESYLEAVSRLQNDQTRFYEAAKRVESTRSRLKIRSGYSEPVIQDMQAVIDALLEAPLPEWNPTAPSEEELTNEEVLRFENLAEQADKERDIHRSRTRPKLNLLISAFQDEVNSIGTSEGITRTNFFFGVRIAWEIFDGWEADARVRQANIKKRRYEFEMDQAKIQLLDTIELLLQELDFAKQAIENRKGQLKYLDERVAKYELEVQQGRRTENQLKDVMISRDQGLFTLVQAHVDFHLLYAQLHDLLTGTERLAEFLTES